MKQNIDLVLTLALGSLIGCHAPAGRGATSSTKADDFYSALNGPGIVSRIESNDLGRITVIRDPALTGNYQDAYVIVRAEKVEASGYAGTGIHLVLVGGMYPETKKAPEIANFDLSPEEASRFAVAAGDIATQMQSVAPDTPEHTIYWRWSAASHLQVIAGRGEKPQFYLVAPNDSPLLPLSPEQMLDLKAKILSAVKLK